MLYKLFLIYKDSNINYEGDVLIRITWNPKDTKILNNLDILPNSFYQKDV